jgi:hypothetical protein
MLWLPELGRIMCWASDCGRYYSQHHLGYFHLRAATPTPLAHIDKGTQGMMRCSSDTCTADSPMVIIRANLSASDEGKPNWHCFECGLIGRRVRSQTELHAPFLWKSQGFLSAKC